MIFTCEEDPNPWGRGDKARHQYIKDDKGYIIGSVYPFNHGGWSWQSCDNQLSGSWSDPGPVEPTRTDAINMAIADYIARRME